MELRYAVNPADVKHYDTERLRQEFLIDNLMEKGAIHGFYSHYDRMITIGAVPVDSSIKVPAYEDFTKAEFFLERREMGVINIGNTGTVKVDGESYTLENRNILYVGKGNKEIELSSNESSNPAYFYIQSCPAHAEYPTAKGSKETANPVHLGSREYCNERTIYQQIHDNGIQSCQLVMGFTEVEPGSVWNTFPPHTHDRRMENYFYFEVPENNIVVHFMGQPDESRHIAVKNLQGVMSPSWSIHAGAGTAPYSFVWAMAGENKSFADMDGVNLMNFR